jgi:hypothetical protein
LLRMACHGRICIVCIKFNLFKSELKHESNDSLLARA